MAAIVRRQCLLQVLVIFYLTFPAAFALPQSSLKEIEQVNEDGPYYGLIAASRTQEKAFLATKAFVPNSNNPYVKLTGRLYRVGTVSNKKVIYVRSGVGMVNAAVVTQQLLDLFNVTGIIHFGLAGSANESISGGDVVIPKQFIQTGLWDWLNPNGTLGRNDFAKLDIGDYNVPKRKGKNSLGRIGYTSEEFYSVSGKPNVPTRLIWVKVHSQWLQQAATLEGKELENCVGSSFCAPNSAKLLTNVSGSTANIFVDNEAYRDFLFDEFQVSSVDMESFPVVMTSHSNGFPALVVRGISKLAGEEGHSYSALAAANAARVVVRVLKVLSSADNTMLAYM